MKKKPNKFDTASALVLFSQLGITLFATIATSLAIGYFLDRWLGTSPWLILLFLFLGIGAAIRSLYYMVMLQFNKGDEDNE